MRWRVTVRGLARPSKPPRGQARVGEAHYAAQVNADEVLAIYSDLHAESVPVWIDGGWCVDALLGKQTRGSIPELRQRLLAGRDSGRVVRRTVLLSFDSTQVVAVGLSGCYAP
ncbi:nucleotidyltransferase domain-containing protein [Nonomuraea sp. LPB2021202275-12-8]|uniref:nucleotidyltransferase domain-containing protein n=1 Tax=Nonomuraea sp. LPB2021202275-12-8 TaxID=3120159 RepID=UPI003FA582E9